MKKSSIKKNSTKKTATTNLYELQTLLFIETIENDLNIKHSTVVNYLRYLFAIHFFERQVHIDNIDSKFDEYKKNKHARHYLANFISLSNFNLFAVNIIDNANKVKEYIENNKEQRKLIRQSIKKEIINNSSSKIDIKEKIKKALAEEKTLQNKKVITKLNIIDYVDVFDFNYVKRIFPVGLILYSFKKKNIPYTTEMEEYVERHQILHDLTKNNNMQVLNRKLNCRTDVSLYVNDTFSTNKKENRQIKKAFKDRMTVLIDRVYKNSEDLYFDKPCFFAKSATTSNENNKNIFNLSWSDIEKEIDIDNQKFYVENFYSNIRGKSTYMICLQNNLKRAKDLLKINSIVINKNTNELISNNNQFVFLQRRLLISNIINNADLIAA